MLFNVYCDESCHLEHDRINDMVIGAVWCPQRVLKKVKRDILEIKRNNQIPASLELKWTKISPGKVKVYKDLIEYFFANDSLHLRAVVIPDKSKLRHQAFGQTHDDWYYKMYFDLLQAILSPMDCYEIYLDIKDKSSFRKTQKLREVCSNSMYDFSRTVIKKMQPIRSEELQIMQLTDILIGAIGYQNRVFPEDFRHSEAKLEIINLIRRRSNYTLTRTTLLREEKCNLLVWRATE